MNEPYVATEHWLGLIHWERLADSDDIESDPIMEVEIKGLDVRRLKTWLELQLRTDDCPAARDLLSVCNHVVYDQAYERGKQDAYEIGESRNTTRAGVYRDGYDEGFAIGMSEKFEQQIAREGR